MANPRDHIRAAQAAELRGDKARASAELRKAAEFYRRAGNPVRALQLLRHAQSLDPSQELSEELLRLEASPEAPSARDSQAGDSEDLQAARRRALDWAFQNAQEEEKAAREWSLEEEAAQAQLPMRPVEEPESPAEEPGQEPLSVKPHSSSVALEVRPLVEGDYSAIVADVEVDSYVPVHTVHAAHSSQGEAGDEAPRSEEPSLIDRGPTRADPAIDAWCSFCCRPSVEVGELVAAPTGSFICATCVNESRGLLSLENTVIARPRSSRRKDEHSEAVGLVGQEEARALLERALEAGARRVLVLGPEGTGKTVWFRELAREDRGTLVMLDTLEQGGGGSVVLVEDVDRLMPDDWVRLGGILARYPERTVLMSARGIPDAPSLVLQGASGSLPVFTTSALSQAVMDSVPLELLEQVQVAIPLQVPTEAEFMEIARRRLAPRGSELSLSQDVLAAFAAEAAHSPRAGHELNALLTRVLPGSWSLAGEEKKARGKKAAGKRAAGKGAVTKPARRGRRKGTE
jgi:hypothetical protein